MKCPSCGTELVKGARFCSQCGKSVSGQRPAVPQGAAKPGAPKQGAPKKAAPPEAPKNSRLGTHSSSRARAFLDRSEADATKTRSQRRRFLVKLLVFFVIAGAGAFLAAARGWLGPDAERLARPHDPTAGKLPPWLEKMTQQGDGEAAVTSASSAPVESASNAAVESASGR